MNRERDPYGCQFPQPSFMDRHGALVGAALMSLSAIAVIGAMILLAIITLPDWIGQQQANSAIMVAQSMGIEP